MSAKSVTSCRVRLPLLDDEPLNLDGESASLSCSDLKVVVGNGVIGKFQRHPQCEITRMPGALATHLVNAASRLQGLSQRRLPPIRDEPKRVQEIAFPRAISPDENRQPAELNVTTSNALVVADAHPPDARGSN